MSQPPFRSENPYIGPRAYQRNERLFGRGDEVRELFYLLTAERIVLLHSPSGAGKTSLIQSALVPVLERASFAVRPIIRVGAALPPLPAAPTLPQARFSEDQLLASLLGFEPAQATAPPPGPTPPPQLNRYLVSTLISLNEGLPASQRLPERSLPQRHLEGFLRLLPKAAASNGTEVLIFDQFEEILTVEPEDLTGKQRFFTEVGHALRDRRRWALFAMREEFVPALAPYLSLLPTRLMNTFRLDLLTEAKAREAIRGPAYRNGVDFTDAAASRLIDDLRSSVAHQIDGTFTTVLSHTLEPVQLQVVCLRLWEKKFQAGDPTSRTIVADDIAQVGDVDEALASYYEDRVQSVAATTGEDERVIREWFETALITAGGLRNQVIAEQSRARGMRRRTVELLINSHLVRSEWRLGSQWYELAHDRLVAPILAANRAWREAHLSMLQKQTMVWLAEGRQDGFLLSGEALKDAERWAAANAPLTSDERAFLAKSQAARSVSQRLRNLAIALFIGFAMAIVFALAALLQTVEANNLRATAQTSAVEANNLRATAQTSEAMAETSAANARLAEATAQTSAAMAETSAANARLAEATAQTSEAIAHEARTVAAEGITNVVIQQRTSEAQATQNANEQATSKAFAEQSATNVAQILDEQTRAQQAENLSDFLAEAEAIGLSPQNDRERIKRALQLWTNEISNINRDQRTIDALQTIVQRAEELSGVEEAIRVNDGATLVTWDNLGSRVVVGGDGVLSIWDADSHQFIIEPTPNTGITSAAWSSDGTKFVTTNAERTIKIWSAEGQLIRSTFTRLGEATYAAWSPDDRLIAAAGSSGVVIWDGTVRAPVAIADSGDETLTRAAWAVDGLSFVTAGDMLRVRDRTSGAVIRTSQSGASPRMISAAWSPNGQMILTVDIDGGVRLWDAASLIEVKSLDTSSRRANAAAWSATGRYFVVGFEDGSVGVYTITDTLQQPLSLFSFRAVTRSVAWSPDGQRFAALSDDGQVRILFFYPDDVIQRAQEINAQLP